MADKFYTPDEIAQELKVTPQAVYNWITKGRLEAIKIGRIVRVPGAAYERLLSEGAQSMKDAQAKNDDLSE
ncbi:MAG: helix-turn-helix domain-containing protein [Chloroflexota bacterium]|nr:helix-turn-helix domain-containing protein [Chloroflexota bacterium]